MSVTLPEPLVATTDIQRVALATAVSVASAAASETDPTWIIAVGVVKDAFPDQEKTRFLFFRLLKDVATAETAIKDLFLITETLHERGAFKAAFHASRTAAEVAPDDPRSRTLVAKCIASANIPKETLELLSILAEKQPEEERAKRAGRRRGPLPALETLNAPPTDAQRAAYAQARAVAAAPLNETDYTYKESGDWQWTVELGSLADVFDNASLREGYTKELAVVSETAYRLALDGLHYVAKMLNARGNAASAWMAARLLVEKFPNDALGLTLASKCAEAMGESSTALAYWQAAADLADTGERVERFDVAVKAFAARFDLAAAAMRMGNDEVATVARSRGEAMLSLATRLSGGNAASLRVLRLARARFDAQVDVPAAIEELTALMVELEPSPYELSRSDNGGAVRDLLLSLLVPAKDRRAVAVQRMMVRAAERQMGEKWPTWVERIKLATVHAALGNADEGRELAGPAFAALRADRGETDANTLAAKRELERHALL